MNSLKAPCYLTGMYNPMIANKKEPTKDMKSIKLGTKKQMPKQIIITLILSPNLIK